MNRAEVHSEGAPAQVRVVALGAGGHAVIRVVHALLAIILLTKTSKVVAVGYVLR